jgi:hypothetical protein
VKGELRLDGARAEEYTRRNDTTCGCGGRTSKDQTIARIQVMDWTGVGTRHSNVSQRNANRQ